ncbi:MAG: OmpA family protein [Pseudohongiellaceae bacterium]
MNLTTKISSALFVSAGLFTPLALADAGQFYIAPGLQWMEFDDTTHLSPDTGYFLGFGYDLTDRISAELSTFDLDPDGPGNSSIDMDHYKVDIIYNLGANTGKWTPFVVGGVGSNNLAGENDPVWVVGGGIKYKFSDNWTWRTAVRGHFNAYRDHEDGDYGVDTALVYRFGGNKARSAAAPAAAARPATAVPASAPAATDSDGDGVPDSRDNCPDTPRNYAVDADGCPIPVEEVARVELEVHFDFDRWEVKPEFFSEIEEVADFMAQYPDVVVELEGHTDSRGTEQYNLGLSDRRTAAVRQVMIDRFNVQASRVSTVGFGESRPIASNDTDAGRAENRRVVTVIIKTLQNYRPR